MCPFALAHEQGPRPEPGDWKSLWARLFGHSAVKASWLQAAGWTLLSDGPVLEANGIWFAGDIRLDNGPELRTALDLETTDALSLVAAAWERWGEALADHLIGDFALVVVQPSRNTVYAARDALGAKPLFYHVGPTLRLFGTAGSALAAHPHLRARPSRAGIWMWLQNDYDDRVCMYDGLTGLNWGESLGWSERGLRVWRYWKPEQIPLWRASREVYLEAYRDILARATRDRCASENPVIGCTLSGGLDSSSVAAMAVRTCREQGKTLMPLSVRFENDPEADESALIMETCAFLDLQPTWINHRDVMFLDGELGGPPSESPLIGFGLWFQTLARQVKVAGGDVLLTGHGGDNIHTGIREADLWCARAQRGNRLAWQTLRARFGYRLSSIFWRCWVEPLLSQVLLRRLRPYPRERPEWIPPAYADEWLAHAQFLQERPRLFWEIGRQKTFEMLVYHAAGVRRAIHHLDGVGEKEGVSIRHPFFDRRLVELMCSLPAEEVRPGTLSKAFCRDAMAHHLPKQVLATHSKPRFGAFYHQGIKNQHAKLRALMQNSRLVDEGFVDSRRWLEALDGFLASDPFQARADLLPVLVVENWLVTQAGTEP